MWILSAHRKRKRSFSDLLTCALLNIIANTEAQASKRASSSTVLIRSLEQQQPQQHELRSHRTTEETTPPPRRMIPQRPFGASVHPPNPRLPSSVPIVGLGCSSFSTFFWTPEEWQEITKTNGPPRPRRLCPSRTPACKSGSKPFGTPSWRPV